MAMKKKGGYANTVASKMSAAMAKSSASMYEKALGGSKLLPKKGETMGGMKKMKKGKMW